MARVTRNMRFFVKAQSLGSSKWEGDIAGYL